MATARKIATTFYVMIRKQVEYDASIWPALDAQQETRYEAKLRRQAERRGFVLVPKTSVPTTTTAMFLRSGALVLQPQALALGIRRTPA
jgi:hypothetical protein